MRMRLSVCVCVFVCLCVSTFRRLHWDNTAAQGSTAHTPPRDMHAGTCKLALAHNRAHCRYKCASTGSDAGVASAPTTTAAAGTAGVASPSTAPAGKVCKKKGRPVGRVPARLALNSSRIITSARRLCTITRSTLVGMRHARTLVRTHTHTHAHTYTHTRLAHLKHQVRAFHGLHLRVHTREPVCECLRLRHHGLPSAIQLGRLSIAARHRARAARHRVNGGSARARARTTDQSCVLRRELLLDGVRNVWHGRLRGRRGLRDRPKQLVARR